MIEDGFIMTSNPRILSYVVDRGFRILLTMTCCIISTWNEGRDGPLESQRLQLHRSHMFTVYFLVEQS